MKVVCRETENWRGHFTESLFVKREDVGKVNLTYISDYGIDTFIDSVYSFPASVDAVLFTDMKMFQGSMTERSKPDWFRNVDFATKVERLSGGVRQLIEECTDPSDVDSKKRISNMFNKYYYNNEWCLIRSERFNGFELDDPTVTLLSISGGPETAVLMVRPGDFNGVRFIKTIKVGPETRHLYSIDKEVEVLRLSSGETKVVVEKHFQYRLPYAPDVDVDETRSLDEVLKHYTKEGWVALSPDLVKKKEA